MRTLCCNLSGFCCQYPEYDMEDVETYRKETSKLSPEQLLHTIKFRRSIRDYKPEPISQHLLEELLQVGRYTATAKNSRAATSFLFKKSSIPLNNSSGMKLVLYHRYSRGIDSPRIDSICQLLQTPKNRSAR